MSLAGKVGPEHARKTAELRLFSENHASHSLDQRIAQVGPGHRLFRAVPKGVPPAAGWPILYLLDGNAAFDFLSAENLAQAAGLVIVGIGYDTERQFARERRTLDFTAPDLNAPGADGEGLRPDPVHEGRIAGGAAQFLARLAGPLRAAAEEGLAIDPTRRTLWGHSFGGLFTLYAALHAPALFARYAPISPSIWWDEPLILRVAAAAEAFAPGTAPPMLAALGDMEKRSGSDGPQPDGPAPATMGFLAQIARHPGYAPQITVLKGLRHIETLPASLALVIPFALGAG